MTMRTDSITEPTSKDIVGFFSDTAKMLAETQAENAGLSLLAAHNAGALANEIEFWRWLSQNYHCLDDANGIQEIAKRSPDWLRKIIQGKGYEWDFMTQQRGLLRNLFARFNAGTNPTQPGIDITKTSLLSGDVLETFQNKAYTSGQIPNLKHTPKSVPVVTNAENAQAVQDLGYDVIEFQDNDTIIKRTDARMQSAQEGTAYTHYTPRAVVGTMAKAGLGAAVIGAGIETIASYKKYKQGEITKQEYLKEIAKSGALAGITGSGTAGIMIPISGAITAAGIAQPWLIPVSFIISASLNKIVAPAFGRGDYAKLIEKAKYYQSLSDMQTPLIIELNRSATQFEQFIIAISELDHSFDEILSFNLQFNMSQLNTIRELQDTTPFDRLNNLIQNI